MYCPCSGSVSYTHLDVYKRQAFSLSPSRKDSRACWKSPQAFLFTGCCCCACTPKTTKQNNTQPTIFHLSFILVPFPAIIRSNFYKDTGKFLKTSPPASKQKTCVKKKFLTQAGFIQPNRFLIVIGEQFKISFRMQAGRTNFGRSFADMYICLLYTSYRPPSSHNRYRLS